MVIDNMYLFYNFDDLDFEYKVSEEDVMRRLGFLEILHEDYKSAVMEYYNVTDINALSYDDLLNYIKENEDVLEEYRDMIEDEFKDDAHEEFLEAYEEKNNPEKFYGIN